MGVLKTKTCINRSELENKDIQMQFCYQRNTQCQTRKELQMENYSEWRLARESKDIRVQ